MTRRPLAEGYFQAGRRTPRPPDRGLPAAAAAAAVAGALFVLVPTACSADAAPPPAVGPTTGPTSRPANDAAGLARPPGQVVTKESVDGMLRDLGVTPDAITPVRPGVVAGDDAPLRLARPAADPPGGSAPAPARPARPSASPGRPPEPRPEVVFPGFERLPDPPAPAPLAARPPTILGGTTYGPGARLDEWRRDEAAVRAAAARLARRAAAGPATPPASDATPATRPRVAARPPDETPAATSPTPARPGEPPPPTTRPAGEIAGGEDLAVATARRVLEGDPYADDTTLSAAAAVATAGGLTDATCEALAIRLVATNPANNPQLLRQVCMTRPAALIDLIVRIQARSLVLSAYFTPKVVRELAAADPAVFEALLHVADGPEWDAASRSGISARERAQAISLLDVVGDAADGKPQPLPVAATAALGRLLYYPDAYVGQAAADALARHTQISKAERDLVYDHFPLLYGPRADDSQRLGAVRAAANTAANGTVAVGALTRVLRQGPNHARTLAVRGLLAARPEARASAAGQIARWMVDAARRPGEGERGPTTHAVGEAARPQAALELGYPPTDWVFDAFPTPPDADVLESVTALLLRSGPLPADALQAVGLLLATSAQRPSGELLLAAAGPAAIPVLVDVYARAGTDEPTRAAVARVLGQPELGGADAEARLLTLFAADRSGEVRRAAAAGLGRARARTADARAALAAALADPNLPTRAAVADALASVGPPRDLPPGPAADLVRRGTPDERAAGARLLAALGTRALGECAADLARMADNVNPVLRWCAAAALAQVDAGGAYTGRAVVAAARYQDTTALDKLLGTTGLATRSPVVARVAGDRKTILSLNSLAADHPDPGVRRTAEETLDRLAAGAAGR